MQTYKSIDSLFHHKIEIKRSKFIAYIVPYSIFDEYRERLKKEHPKASHIVYAYRDIHNGNISEAFSDDGEPKGCAGMPILKVLRGWDLVNVGVLVVRYFGGIKLGTGGMVRAYTQSVQELLKEAPLIDYIQKDTITISSTYDKISKIEYICREKQIDIVSRDFGTKFVNWQLRGQKEALEYIKNI